MIQLRNVTKCYSANTKAVDNISFNVNTSQICSIIGPSGCGKTTTLKMINRLIEPTSGEIKVSGEDFHSMDAVTWRRKIGYVIQKAGLLPHLTVFENVSLLSNILKKPKSQMHDRVDELLNLVNLDPKKFKNRYPKELSGGQQQRVGIARALMENPPLLLMDEPFGALDPITRNSLHEEFLHLNAKMKKTIIIVTHDMNEAFKLSDKIIIMKTGKIIQQGSKEELMSQPADSFVSEFLNQQEL